VIHDQAFWALGFVDCYQTEDYDDGRDHREIIGGINKPSYDLRD
jgi:hypothetical protein